jgi:hypothetical protein
MRYTSVSFGAMGAALLASSAHAQCSSPVGCFIAHDGLGCNNAQCCEAVCAADPFCCQVKWDGFCVDGANAICFDCGFELSGSCFALSEPACDDGACCTTVCAIDPACCKFTWDTFCISNAVVECAGCGKPGAGSCFEVHLNVGCGSADCCTLTCSADPFCCESIWDSICVGEAFSFCLPPCAADLSHDGKVDAADLGVMLGAWGVSPVGDLDLDADNDAADLGLLLGAWGTCEA